MKQNTSRKIQILRLAPFAFATLALAACEPNPAPTQSRQPTEIAAFSTRFPLQIGAKKFVAQIALTQLEITQGLMFREKLAPDEGMLFVFETESPREFWMRNVPIPLALAYFTSDGKLDEIKAMLAQNPDVVPSRSQNVRFVLEMRDGWFDSNNIPHGTKLDLAPIRDAIRARGFSPEKYGL